MLDSVKVIFDGLVSIWTRASIDVQAHHQIALHIYNDLRERSSFIYKSTALNMLLLHLEIIIIFFTIKITACECCSIHGLQTQCFNKNVFAIRIENWKKKKTEELWPHLPAVDQVNDGHGQLYHHQDEEQDEKLQRRWNISDLFTIISWIHE